MRSAISRFLLFDTFLRLTAELWLGIDNVSIYLSSVTYHLGKQEQGQEQEG